MSQNPYEAYGNTTESAPEARTSMLAIASLVSSLICCIPVVTGALGVILGGIALFRISASNGRRKGVGLAIAGIIVGLVVSFIWLFVAIGAYSGLKQFSALAQPVVDSLNMSDAGKLRSSLNPTLAAQVTDADWASFKSKIEAELGTLEPPTNPIEFFSSYGKAGQLMSNHRGGGNEIPIPLKGSKGYGMMLIEMPRNSSNQGTSMSDAILGNALNIGVILPSGNVVYLVDPDALKVGTPATKPALPAPAESAEPAEPAGGDPKPKGV
ncbi:MAG: DUF4190 domain-containing protein [Phycisphaerales bacterium]|nr:DUF4190 domain-containing protein [Phycisphaerales bacterium]